MQRLAYERSVRFQLFSYGHEIHIFSAEDWRTLRPDESQVGLHSLKRFSLILAHEQPKAKCHFYTCTMSLVRFSLIPVGEIM